MKKGIGLIAFGGKEWIGGIYYIRNIAYQLSLNGDITDKYNIVIFTQEDQLDAFRDLPSSIRIETVKHGKKNLISFLYRVVRNHISCLYPSTRSIQLLNLKGIWWIPDFQYKTLPNLFSAKEIEFKDRDIRVNVDKGTKIIVSSGAALNDFYTYFSPKEDQVSVMRFISYIEPIINSIRSEEEILTLHKYGLDKGSYTCIMNQFWQHKNHIVVLNAMRELYKKHPDIDFKFVFSGNLSDYRAQNYIEKIKKIFDEDIIRQNSIVTGFIDRKEQIILMKNSAFIIQPSLFEGWGTVVEDAKVLNKTILLSDIPVHREQCNNKCTLFDPYNPLALADLIESEVKKEHIDEIEVGIEDAHKRARQYSEGFVKTLKEMGEKI